MNFKDQGCLAAIVDAPVLFESGFDSECDLVIGVVANVETRISRIVLRDRISREAAIARINSQMTDDELVSRCDFIINNDSDFDSLEIEVRFIVNKIFDK